jgi:replicative DNA helicase
MAPSAGAGRDFTAPQEPQDGAWNE